MTGTLCPDESVSVNVTSSGRLSPESVKEYIPIQENLELVDVRRILRSLAGILAEIANDGDPGRELVREDDAEILGILDIVVGLLVGPLERVPAGATRGPVDRERDHIIAARMRCRRARFPPRSVSPAEPERWS